MNDLPSWFPKAETAGLIAAGATFPWTNLETTTIALAIASAVILFRNYQLRKRLLGQRHLSDNTFLLNADYDRLLGCAFNSIKSLNRRFNRMDVRDPAAMERFIKKLIKMCASCQLYIISQAASKQLGERVSCCIKIIDENGQITPENTVRDVHSNYARKRVYSGVYHYTEHSLFKEILEKPHGLRRGYLNNLSKLEREEKYSNPNKKRRALYNATCVNLIGDNFLDDNSPMAFLCLDAKHGEFDDRILSNMWTLAAEMLTFVEAYVDPRRFQVLDEAA